MQNDNNERPDIDLENLSHEDAQRILQVGEHASQLLSAPVFNLAYRNVMDTLYHQWLGSKPKEQLLRESLFNQARGLTEVTQLLGAAVDDAKLVMANQEAENDPKTQRQEYLDNQGFGHN